MGIRILSGIIGGAVYIGLGLLGGAWLALGLGALLVLGIYELWRLCRAHELRLRLEIPVAIGLALVLVLAALTSGAADARSFRQAESIIAFALTALVIAAALSVLLGGKTVGALAGAALTAFAGVYVAFPLAYMLLLRNLPGADGQFYFFYLTIVTWVNDTAAYFAGSAFGRRRLAPAVSPHKTIEGAVAGVLGAVLAGALFAAFCGRNPLQAGLLALLLGPLGQSGDLFESILKRDMGAKDSGAFLPGHGGVLDRFDSILFTAPVMYYAAAYLL